ncbi:uncharacterized protein BJ171DRAFT_216657 [Polychytrium aggregatum]|uniref:uncharacterized protein n=1 Tax=Polychytrium aggregatum TaxID=110093 RepID=UPI0022FE9F4D|nr:uncharacterized protein BJ171DRAFT_216657 [Polychytrium aggregatum]KAI9199363.1 hypothetical protein BJ171DRAFT_216657 [Polychytrium aggregatum]
MTSPPSKIRRTLGPANNHTASCAPPSLFSALEKHDILTILITNDTFVANLSPKTLSRLIRASKYHRRILDCHSVWACVLNPLLGITQSLFAGLDPSVDRKIALQGLFCYINRQTPHSPRSPAAHQKELKLWWEVYKSNMLRSRIRDYCGLRNKMLEYPWDLVALISRHRQPPKLLTSAEEFRFLDSAYILHDPCLFECNRFVMLRSRHHPFLLDSQLTELLPHERFHLERSTKLRLMLYNCTPSIVMDWATPSRIISLSIEESSTAKLSWDWNELPPDLLVAELSLPCSIESLQTMPQPLMSLTALKLCNCTKLVSLEGLPARMPKLKELTLPPSLETLQGLPQFMKSLRALDLSQCWNLSNLAGLPTELPGLESLALPPTIRNLEDMPQSMESLVTLIMDQSTLVTSLVGLPGALPKLETLLVPASIESLHGLPRSLNKLESLDLSKCTRLAHLDGLPENMAHLSRFRLPRFLNSLEGFDLGRFPKLRHVDMPRLLLLQRRM